MFTLDVNIDEYFVNLSAEISGCAIPEECKQFLQSFTCDYVRHTCPLLPVGGFVTLFLPTRTDTGRSTVP